jgi:hypothetical protein
LFYIVSRGLCFLSASVTVWPDRPFWIHQFLCPKLPRHLPPSFGCNLQL